MNDASETIKAANLAKSVSDVSPPAAAGASIIGATVAATEGVSGRIGRYRWVICALLFFATTINYVDRQVLGFLSPDLQRAIGWNEAQYGWIVTSFTIAYAISLLVVGRIIDWLGTRKGLSLAVIVWSLAAMAHALANSAIGFGIARFGLGLGEGGNFPASIKTVAEWFPKKERALATGIFNAGSNLGPIIVPLTVPWIVSHYGWHGAFLATGALGFVWLIFWLMIYHKPDEHPAISGSELALIQSDPSDRLSSYPWAPLLRKRETWAFALGKGLTDPVWWFYLFWLPKYLQETFGLSLFQAIVPLLVLYNLTTIGSIGGGWLSSTLIDRGWTVNKARKTAMFICALGVVPVIYAPYSKNLWVVVALVGTALSLRGAPYRNGGADPQGFDCSGFTQYVFARYGVALPREVRDQFQQGKSVKEEELAAGDLLFFTTVAPGASHVGIAIGGDQFVHAPSEKGVVRVEQLSGQYWSSRFVGARRVD